MANLTYNPVTGGYHHYPVSESDFRASHVNLVWYYHPWSGRRRLDHHVRNDPYGLRIDRPYAKFRNLDLSRLEIGHQLMILAGCGVIIGFDYLQRKYRKLKHRPKKDQ